mgnify:CR=1 FL=1
MALRDMLYVSYLLPAERIARMVPRGLVPATADGSNGFLSLVIFKGNTREALHVPAPPIPFDQVNIRTYVIDPRTGGFLSFPRDRRGAALTAELPPPLWHAR